MRGSNSRIHQVLVWSGKRFDNFSCQSGKRAKAYSCGGPGHCKVDVKGHPELFSAMYVAIGGRVGNDSLCNKGLT